MGEGARATADSKTLVTCGNDGFLRVWDVAKLAAR